MMIWKRAIRYVARKRSKCLLIFMILFIIGVFIDNVNIVAHEASHCTTHIMEFLGIKDDEFRAYMVGYITQEICLKLREIKDKDEKNN